MPEDIDAGAAKRAINASRSATAALTSTATPSWWPSTVTRISVVVGPEALSADWRQHQRRALTRPASSTKMTSPGSGDSRSPEPRSVNVSLAGREADGRSAGHRLLVEDRHGQRVADGDEVADVDERVDRRDRALLGQPPEERLGRRAVGRRVDTEGAEGAPPGGDARQLGQRRRADPGERRRLLRLERLDQLIWRRPVRQPDGMDHAADDRRKAVRDGRVVREASQGAAGRVNSVLGAEAAAMVLGDQRLLGRGP